MEESVLTLRKFVAPEFVFGQGARKLVHRYVRNFGGRRILLVSDPGLARAGWSGEIRTLLEDGGIACVMFDGVSPNPRNTEVAAGVDAYRAGNCDLIVAVGGGSVMDCAKGIGICVANGRAIDSFEGVDRVADPSPPLICVPTTAGSAADVSQFAIISDRRAFRKFAIVSKTVVPDVALIDPDTTATLDRHLTACTGIDALAHAVEAYVSTARSAFTDSHALAAVSLVRRFLPAVLADPANAEARARMMLACTHAGLAFSNASLGVVHAMAHSVGGWLDLPHGECNALLLPHAVAFNHDAEPSRYRAIADGMGIRLDAAPGDGDKRRLTDGLVDFIRSLGVEPGLSRRGIAADDIRGLAENAMTDPCLVTNPRQPDRRDVEVIFEDSL